MAVQSGSLVGWKHIKLVGWGAKLAAAAACVESRSMAMGGDRKVPTAAKSY